MKSFIKKSLILELVHKDKNVVVVDPKNEKIPSPLTCKPKIIIVDPEQEYQKMVRTLEKTNSKSVILNPFLN